MFLTVTEAGESKVNRLASSKGLLAMSFHDEREWAKESRFKVF